MQAVFVGGLGRLLPRKVLRGRKRVTAFPSCSRRCFCWHEWTNLRQPASLPDRLASQPRHNGSSQAATTAPGRFGSLVDNFCIVDHPSAGTHGVPPRRPRQRLHRLAMGKSGPPEPGLCAPPDPPFRAVLHRGAAHISTMFHPFRCVMAITITGIGTDAALPCIEPLWVLFREAAMDEDLKQDIAGSTQRLLADRLRQRYARCRKTLASYASEADAPPAATRVPLRLAVVQKDPASPQRRPTGSGERFATLFSQAYSAARDSRDNAPAPMPRRDRQRVTA
jgi:hypothetical protein